MKFGRCSDFKRSSRRLRQASEIAATIVIFLLLEFPQPSFAAENAPSQTGDQTSEQASKKATVAPRSDYCANIARPAVEARYAFQKKTLDDLQNKIKLEIKSLEEKQQFILAFEEKQKKQEIIAQKLVVDIFAKMKPDVAAKQLEKVDVQTSVSILSQLNVRVASTILNEMQTDTAASIATAMAEAQPPAVPN